MGNSESKQPMGTLPKNLMLPPRFEAFHASGWTSDIQLGTSPGQPMYTIVVRKGGTGQLELYQGAGSQSPCLAVLESRNMIKSTFNLRLANDQSYEIKPTHMMSEGFKFTVPAGYEGRPEEFAWHSASKSDVRNLGAATTFAMKLTRESGPRKGEIVALWSHPELKEHKLHSAAVFGFCGDANMLGVEFVIAAVLTFIQIYQTRIMTIMMSTTNSGAAGAAIAAS
ncbi:ATP synthase alpha chain precursor [Fusarium albosuccineum]|uniref:ATP synthase alpha chain n=1 Tax=Fusarium albosuccineum TaxID=1237068 RepID=A0A8H4LA54_9HYPO|nr:ATP synthase alpha chain precursor [Fusarium albosuccineum]